VHIIPSYVKLSRRERKRESEREGVGEREGEGEGEGEKEGEEERWERGAGNFGCGTEVGFFPPVWQGQ